MQAVFEAVGAAALPVLFLGIGALFLLRRGSFDAFLCGAEQGLRESARLLPTLLLLVTTVSLLQGCGILEPLARLFAPLLARLGLSVHILPLLFLRPVSGSASTAQLSEIFSAVGPDSPDGILASVILGSSETVFYVIAVYFGAVNVKKSRYALPAALLVMLFSVGCAVFFCRFFVSLSPALRIL